MTERSTRPLKVEGPRDAFRSAWQPNEISWSFGPTQRRVIGWPDRRPSDSDFAGSKNQNGPSTAGPQEIKSPEWGVAAFVARDFGRRGLAALSHWEGVVEDVEGDKFRCRLVPLTPGAPHAGDFELAEFSFDDLANEDDRALVQQGAVFYWTIGRARNHAGSVANVSLVRFRRLPAVTLLQHKRAQREAEGLLLALGGENGPDSSES